MSRITAPVAKLTRSLNSAATASRSSGLLESHYNVNKGAVLMPKYAELLKNRSPREHDSARTLTTTHRPTPQPTRASPSHRQMQTFAASSASSAGGPIASMDFTTLPMSYEPLPAANEFAGMRMPLLPDAFTTKHRSLYQQPPADEVLPSSRPEISIVAAHPENVTAAALTEVEAFGVDGVELKWAHESELAPEAAQPGLRDLWKGLVDDVMGSQQQKAAF
ncbi:hypothetical protein CGRA01v4_11017 [Colletotrichum graminicola]|uniref:Uncharacterized protein n=1 Tax=Colletotrichum graminicola (strain M1.001 / M2 / FGSC 10212) TaxID=645133 RepID=E3QKQ3_COLGM|nr:uncharacterized protein GLRG_06585 [Colletotrichum graminicola M1.001]EFQ31441.1 hypothetical protein GLRG_06585 [Colletotrichum graminicola M1.001]WDK19730.1 hypothetical protein CGRA01v4_11017 [Colletotrichum graminicola]